MQADEPDPEPNALPGSLVGFTRNGHYEGVAYRSVSRAGFLLEVPVKFCA